MAVQLFLKSLKRWGRRRRGLPLGRTTGILAIGFWAGWLLGVQAQVPAPTADGGRSYGFIGVSMSPVSESMAKQMGLPKDKSWGVLVREVVPGGPAQKAGIHAGDIIVGVENQETHDPAQLLKAVAFQNIGSDISVDYYRPTPGGKQAEAGQIRMTVAERKDGVNVEQYLAQTERMESMMSGARTPEPWGADPLAVGGLSIGPAHEGKEVGGLRVFSVVPNSEAAAAGLFPGDRVIEVNGRRVNTRVELIQALNQGKANQPAQVLFIRDGKQRKARWEVPLPVPTPNPQSSPATTAPAPTGGPPPVPIETTK